MKRSTLVLLALFTAAVIAAVGWTLWASRGRADLAGPAVGGPFQLVDQNGRPADESLLKGKWSAVFFGFTYCPEACPTTLLALGGAENQLGPKAKDFQTVFISVDPVRDTPAVIRNYLSNEAFPKRTVGLTGAPRKVAAAAKAYHVYFQKSGEGPDYLIDHSTMTYLMGPSGRFVCIIPYGLTPEQTAVRIAKAMREGRNSTSC